MNRNGETKKQFWRYKPSALWGPTAVALSAVRSMSIGDPSCIQYGCSGGLKTILNLQQIYSIFFQDFEISYQANLS